MSFATMTDCKLVSQQFKPYDGWSCFICGSRRQRNLIVSYSSVKGESVFWVLSGDPEQAVKDGKLERHVICYRCDSLNLSVDDLRYMKDRYFPKNMRRYKDLKQKCQANTHKRDMRGD